MKPQNGKSDLRDSAHNIVSRRSFLKLVAYGSIMFGLGGLFKLLGKGQQLLRPPGALSEGHFRSLCEHDDWINVCNNVLLAF